MYRWHRPVVYFLLLKCHINRQTQPYRSSILVLWSALLHVSAVYISHHQVGISPRKEQKGERERNWYELESLS